MPLTTRLRYVAGRYLPFLRIAPPVDRGLVLTLRPVRNPAIVWETGSEGEALLQIPRRADRVGKLIGFWFPMPETRAVQLDEVGTFVWGLCDGSHTIEGIVRETGRHYMMNRREVEVSVTAYLQTLLERRFIQFYRREERAK